MFRFTIRDVLWLTVVVALAVGWFVERSRLLEQNRSLQVQQADHQAALAQQRAELSRLRMDALWAKELRGEIILPAAPRATQRVR